PSQSGVPVPAIARTAARRPDLVSSLAEISSHGKLWAFESAPRTPHTVKLAMAGFAPALSAGESKTVFAILRQAGTRPDFLAPLLAARGKFDDLGRRQIAEYFSRTAKSSVGAAGSLPKDAVAAHFEWFLKAGGREKTAVAAGLQTAFLTASAKNPFPENFGPRDPGGVAEFRRLLASRNFDDVGPAMGYFCSVVEPTSEDVAAMRRRLELELKNEERTNYGTMFVEFIERNRSSDGDLMRIARQYRIAPTPRVRGASMSGS
ncbi:MAG TPA: hypothetical protein VNC50_18270, partial [Planctomycetia bacterium]|nr:hypothetical protein [Planctomycetia bacterium]